MDRGAWWATVHGVTKNWTQNEQTYTCGRSEGWQRAEDQLNWVGWLGAWFARGKGEKTDEGKCQSWSEQAMSYPVR